MSYQNRINLYQERKFSDLFNDSLVFVFRNMVSLTKTVLVFVGPIALLSFLVIGFISYQAVSPVSLLSTPFYFFDYWSGVGSILSFILIFLLGIFFYLTLNSYILRYGESTDGEVILREVWEDIKTHFVHFLGIGVIRMAAFIVLVLSISWLGSVPSSISIVIGASMIILYLGVSISLADVIRMNEGGSVIHALRYSFQLVHQNWFPTLGLYLSVGILNVLILLVLWVVSLVLSLVVSSWFVYSIMAMYFENFFSCVYSHGSIFRLLLYLLDGCHPNLF